MAIVTRKPLARADLLDIWRYVAADSPASADRLLDRIGRQCKRLARFPGMGRARSELAPSLRSLPVGAYVVFYRPIEGGIDIIRVLHAKRDTGEVMFDPKP